MQTLSHSQAHTQGPWSCVPGEFFSVYSYVDGEPIAVPKTEANAALIAAAPELLEIVKEFADITPFKTGYSIDAGLALIDALQKKAEAILAKAVQQ